MNIVELAHGYRTNITEQRVGAFVMHNVGLVQHHAFRKYIESCTKRTDRVVYDLYPKDRVGEQFFPFDRHPKAVVFTDGAHLCLSGFSIFDRGVHAFHYPPGRISGHPFNLPRGITQKGNVVGGCLRHLESYQDMYEGLLGSVRYIDKPAGHEYNTDYSFAFLVDFPSRQAVYGYYFQERPPENAGWYMD